MSCIRFRSIPADGTASERAPKLLENLRRPDLTIPSLCS